jgi:hypothetical protein
VVLQIFEEFGTQVDQDRERRPDDDDPSDIGKAHKKPEKSMKCRFRFGNTARESLLDLLERLAA